MTTVNYLDIHFPNLSSPLLPSKVWVEAVTLERGETCNQWITTGELWTGSYDFALKVVNILIANGYTADYAGGLKDYALLDLLARLERRGTNYYLPELVLPATA